MKTKQVQGASGRAPILELPDGPDAVQFAAMDANGVVTREARVVQTDWRDPDDSTAHQKKTGARYIHGYRRVWTIHNLHTASPRDITERHVKAATRWLDDYQRMFGATSGGQLDRVDNGTSDTSDMDLRILATERWEEAALSMGSEDARFVFHIVVLNRSLTDTADRWDMQRHKMYGRVCGALGRLAEHYWPPTRSESMVSTMPTLEIDGLPGERFGRWRT